MYYNFKSIYVIIITSQRVRSLADTFQLPLFNSFFNENSWFLIPVYTTQTLKLAK